MSGHNTLTRCHLLSQKGYHSAWACEMNELHLLKAIQRKQGLFLDQIPSQYDNDLDTLIFQDEIECIEVPDIDELFYRLTKKGRQRLANHHRR